MAFRLIKKIGTLSHIYGVAGPTTVRGFGTSAVCMHSSADGEGGSGQKLRKAKTPTGHLDDKWESKTEEASPQKREDAEEDVYKSFPDNKNPETGEIGGPRGPEPTRYGDWERKGRVIDF